MAMTNQELAAELLKQPNAQVVMEVDPDGDLFGVLSVHSTWHTETMEPVVVISALKYSEV